MIPNVFVDTWGWVALGNSSDCHHKEACEIFKVITTKHCKLTTSDFVLDETISLLSRRVFHGKVSTFIDGILAMRKQNELSLVAVDDQVFHAAWVLRKKLSDKPKLSFTDCTSFVIMKTNNISQVVTADQHFLQVNMGFSLFSSGQSHL
ncbi:MAG: PIN domain-containing protein [bacterium]